MPAIQARVCGRVQGVGFRFSTQYQARQAGLTGYVRNLPDGDVMLVACGEQRQLDALCAWLRAGGPPGARVDQLVCQPYQGDETFASFTFRY